MSQNLITFSVSNQKRPLFLMWDITSQNLQGDLQGHSRTLGMIYRTPIFKKNRACGALEEFLIRFTFLLVFWSGEIRKTARETSRKIVFSDMEPGFSDMDYFF